VEDVQDGIVYCRPVVVSAVVIRAAFAKIYGAKWLLDERAK
jgi:hypothetical protein